MGSAHHSLREHPIMFGFAEGSLCGAYHGEAVYVIRRKTECNHNGIMYVINTKVPSSFGDDIRLWRLHTRKSVITYQYFGLDKKSLA